MQMLSMAQWSRGAAGLLVVVALAGCSKPAHPPQFSVSGKVTYNQQPLTRGTVEFLPDSSKGTQGPIAYGQIQPDGTFELKTFAPADGAKAGHYLVGVQCFEDVPFDPNAGAPPAPKSLIPIKYADAATSGLTAEVNEGENPPLDIDLSGK